LHHMRHESAPSATAIVSSLQRRSSYPFVF
jgi:hypothetical protein